MTSKLPFSIDPELDLVLERVIEVPRERVWAAWTQPDLLKQWFCPKPWRVTHCEIDLRPGGAFKTVMCGPDGTEIPSAGCYLEVVTHERLIWTDALAPGYRPAAEPFMTGALLLEPSGKGTRYVAMAIHRDRATRDRHEEMGFHQGWGTALDQLVALAKTL